MEVADVIIGIAMVLVCSLLLYMNLMLMKVGDGPPFVSIFRSLESESHDGFNSVPHSSVRRPVQREVVKEPYSCAVLGQVPHIMVRSPARGTRGLLPHRAGKVQNEICHVSFRTLPYFVPHLCYGVRDRQVLVLGV